MRNRLFTLFGGTGFIGRYVVERLADRGARILVISRSPSTHGRICSRSARSIRSWSRASI